MNQLMYQLPLKDTWLPQVFHVMEKAKADSNGDLEDYSVSQLTLDDVRVITFSINKAAKSNNNPSQQLKTTNTPNFFRLGIHSICKQTK